MTGTRKPPPIPRHALSEDVAPTIDGDPELGDVTELTTGARPELPHADATEVTYRPSITKIDHPNATADSTLDEPESPFDDDDD